MAFGIPQASSGGGRQRDAMPLRWSLADPVASVAINMALQKELFASSPLPRCRVQDVYMEPRWPPYQPAGAHDMRDAKTRRRKQKCGKQKGRNGKRGPLDFCFLLSQFLLSFSSSRLPAFAVNPLTPQQSSFPQRFSVRFRGSAGVIR